MAPWSPNRATLVIIEAIEEVLEEDRSEWPLGPRSVEYRLLDKGYVKSLGHHPSLGPSPKAKAHRRKNPSTPDMNALYDKVVSVLARGRRSGRIPWDAIADDFCIAQHHEGFSGPDSFWALVEEWADAYEPVLLDGQPVVIELWCEARGMTSRVRAIAHEYGVSVYSSGGSDHLNPKRDLALRVLDRISGEPRRSTTVLHIGDHDDKGVEIFEVLRDDVTAMVRDLLWHRAPYRDVQRETAALMPWLRFVRLAVTAEQAEALAAQGKHQGRDKSGRWKVQAEATAPHDRAGLIRGAIESLLDMDVFEQTRVTGRAHREDVLRVLASLSEGEEDAEG
jgi:hypothetical protein